MSTIVARDHYREITSADRCGRGRVGERLNMSEHELRDLALRIAFPRSARSASPLRSCRRPGPLTA